jgi:hypothetical protein
MTKSNQTRDQETLMTANFRAATRVLALALLLPLPVFAIGRDLATPRMAMPDYNLQFYGASATEQGFLLRWYTTTRAYGTTADANGVPRLPATSTSVPISATLFPNGDGYLAVSENGIATLDASGATLRNVAFDHVPLFFALAAFDGTNFFLVSAAAGGFTGRLVDRNGHVLSTTALPIAGPTYSTVTADVAASADGFTIIVGDSDIGIYAIQISAAGNVLSRVDVFTPGNQKRYLVSIATNAGQTVAAWTTFGGQTFVHTVALRGGSAAPDSILPGGVEASEKIALLPSRDGFLLLRTVFSGTPVKRRVLAYRLDATGASRDATSTLLLNGTFGVAAATSRTLVLICFPDELQMVERSFVISDSGIAPSATYDVSSTAVRQISPSVASDGVDFFAAWLETTTTTMRIAAGRVTRSGVPLDGEGLVVAESPSSFSNRPFASPAVAFGAGVYLVVYAFNQPPPSTEHDIVGRRFNRDGTPIDPAPFVISRNGTAPNVAFGGGRFLVAWLLVSESSVGGATVGTDGAVGTEQLLSPARPLALPEELGSARRPMIGWNGRHFIVAYDLQVKSLNLDRIRVLRTSPLGIPLDAHTTELLSAGSIYAAIACSEQECLVSFLGPEVIEAAVLHDDAVLHADPPRSFANSHYASYAAVAFDGASYIVAWRTGDSLLGVARFSRGGEPYAISIAGTAKAFPTTPPDLAPSYPVSPPVVASNSAGDTAIVTTELNTGWMIDRAKFYLASELQPRRRATH